MPKVRDRLSILIDLNKLLKWQHRGERDLEMTADKMLVSYIRSTVMQII